MSNESSNMNAAAQEEDADVPFFDVAPEDALQAVTSGDVRVVDVREKYEWDRGHIEGATLVPFNSTAQESGAFGFAKKIASLPDDKPILFVCAGGGRSAQAAEIAAIAGRKNLYNLAGGMSNWQGSGLPTVR